MGEVLVEDLLLWIMFLPVLRFSGSRRVLGEDFWNLDLDLEAFNISFNLCALGVFL